MKIKHLLFGLTATLVTCSAFAANRPSGYITICNEGKTCSVATATNVAFGRADVFQFKLLSGSFVCSEATFGARVSGGVNECSVPSGTATSKASSKNASSISSVVASSIIKSSTSSVARSSIKSSTATSSNSSINSNLGFYPGCEMPVACAIGNCTVYSYPGNRCWRNL
jgi:hypothetical protein